ncbi:MAG: hypothetical protein J6K96_09335 [Treponema sp.]|nr:hypothetical protein [Treponema sp.]
MNLKMQTDFSRGRRKKTPDNVRQAVSKRKSVKASCGREFRNLNWLKQTAARNFQAEIGQNKLRQGISRRKLVKTSRGGLLASRIGRNAALGCIVGFEVAFFLFNMYTVL